MQIGDSIFLESLQKFIHSPLIKVRVDILLHKCAMIMRRITEVIYFVAELTESLYHIWKILISPAACYIYLCHSFYYPFFIATFITPSSLFSNMRYAFILMTIMVIACFTIILDIACKVCRDQFFNITAAATNDLYSLSF